MIPPFDENGYLPPGIHLATLDEIEACFGRESEIRRSQMESLRWLVDLAQQAGGSRLILNGSFTTELCEPNDVDCLLLFEPETFPNEGDLRRKLFEDLPFIAIDLVQQDDFNMMITDVFGTDRMMVPKGMIEVISWH